ncbi:MAG: hypothetical protein SPK72_06150, partial [Bacteroidales bacterium]|nr:hypothetical protein [Bacteroidales bacterium]
MNNEEKNGKRQHVARRKTAEVRRFSDERLEQFEREKARREGDEEHRERRPFGERKPYGERKSFGRRDDDRDDRRERGERGDRKSFGDRKPYGERSERKP